MLSITHAHTWIFLIWNKTIGVVIDAKTARRVQCMYFKISKPTTVHVFIYIDIYCLFNTRFRHNFVLRSVVYQVRGRCSRSTVHSAGLLVVQDAVLEWQTMYYLYLYPWIRRCQIVRLCCEQWITLYSTCFIPTSHMIGQPPPPPSTSPLTLRWFSHFLFKLRWQLTPKPKHKSTS